MIVFVTFEKLFGLPEEQDVNDSSLVARSSGLGGSLFAGHREDDQISSIAEFDCHSQFCDMSSSRRETSVMGVVKNDEWTVHHVKAGEWFTWW